MKIFFVSLFLASFLYGSSEAQNSSLRILDKPMPNLPKDHGTLDIQGTIRLRVEFLADSKVGRIQPITSLNTQLTELAIEAARNINFEAKIENNSPVISIKQVEYVFSYGGWQYLAKFDDLAEAVLQKAIQNLGGEKYLNVKTQIGRGKFSVIREGAVISFQSFTDVIVFPDKERTDFKGGGVKSVQTNSGNSGWVFDGDQELIKVQNEKQLVDFKHSTRVSLDNLLRGSWRKEAKLSYVGKRPATLGKRNEVIKLTYDDGLIVEFEFAADDGLPQKAIYKHLNADNEEVKEEDRYAQFVDSGGVKSPYIIDRFVNGVQSSRINYDSVELNKPIPDSIFAKPTNPKELKKDLKL